MPVEADYVTVTILPDGRMRARDAAAYLGLSLQTLAIWRCRGEGPRFLRLKAGLIFYRQQDLDAWISQADKGPRPKQASEARGPDEQDE